MGSRNPSSEALRAALDALLHDAEQPVAVPDTIWTSWRRSASSGLTPERLTVPQRADGNDDGLLVHAARPVFDALAEDLAAANVALVLTDCDGDILVRSVAERSLATDLDRLFLAPGFVYAEPAVGTNGIGTAIAQREPAFVRGSEHFVDALTSFACAAVPITDPRSGRLLGVVDLTSRARDASALMLPLARRAASEIEERLVDDAGVAERVLMRRMLQARRGWKGPMLFANERVVITNAAAERFVKPEDEGFLRQLAREVQLGGHPSVVETVMSNGTAVRLRCEAILDGSSTVGVVMHLESGNLAPRPKLGLSSLTDTERAIAELVSEGLTNRQVAEHVFVSRHTVDFHLRSIFRKLGVASRIDLARQIVSAPVAT
jgi:transcriptional regulator of acetoin/glycerol metabolism/DNA-binding CsgD family transcriptional regulator